MKTLEEIKKKVVTCSICGKKVYASDANKHMHYKEMGWDKKGLRPIRQEIIDFIQDQQSHEVENETILDKIPNLVEYLSDKLLSQTKQELIEEIKKALPTHKDGMISRNEVKKILGNL